LESSQRVLPDDFSMRRKLSELRMSASASASILSWFPEYYQVVSTEIFSVFGRELSQLDKAAQEAVSEGRRIRAILAMLWCEALSGDYHAAVPIAAAYELAHSAALIEDDIIDDSRSKEGADSVVAKYGIPRAILTSNDLLFYASKMVAKYARSGVDSLSISRMLDLLADCCHSTAAGESLDLEMTGVSKVSEEEYENMVRMKTGALIGASSASGALIGAGRSNAKIIDDAYVFGESLGVAYQIQDDLVDYLGDEDVMGKSAFTDLKHGKKSLPLIHCLVRCTPGERKFIDSVMGKSDSLDDANTAELKFLLTKYGSDDYCRKSARKHVERALAILGNLEDSKARGRLFEIVEYLSSRS
jgi:geranylgeranyl pyrophosphate synthase